MGRQYPHSAHFREYRPEPVPETTGVDRLARNKAVPHEASGPFPEKHGARSNIGRHGYIPDTGGRLRLSDARPVLYHVDRLPDMDARPVRLNMPGFQCEDLYFGAGGALGFDTLAAQRVLRLRKSYPQIKLILVLPCISQADRWAPEDVRTYREIMKQADKVVYTSQDYSPGCMFKRNRHLVDHSSVCICYLTKGSGGTAHTVEYARERRLEIFNIAKR